MKIFKVIFFFCLVFFIIAIIALIVFLRTFDINDYKDKVVNEASQVLGRDVTIGRIGLVFSLGKGIVLVVDDISVGDAPSVEYGLTAQVDQVRLHTDIMAFIKERKVLVHSFSVKAPVVDIVHRPPGLDPEQPGGIGQAVSSGPKESAPSLPEEGLPEVSIRHIDIQNGTVRYQDQAVTPAQSFDVADIDVQVDDLSLGSSFPFTARFTVLGNSPNVQVKGNAQIDPARSALRIENTRITTRLSAVAVAKLKAALPALELPNGIQWDGDVNTTIKEMTVNPNGLASLAVDGKLENGFVTASGWPVDITNGQIDLRGTEQQINIRDIVWQVGSGWIHAQANVRDYLQAFIYDFDAGLEGLSLEPIVASLAPGIRFVGQVSAQAKGRGTGVPQPGNIKDLDGNATVSVQDGKLLGINVLKVVLSRISVVPNVVEKIEVNLPEKYKKSMEKDETVFERIQSNMTLGPQGVFIDKAELVTDTFSFLATGKFSWDQRLVLESAVHVPADLSASIVTAVPELSVLQDAEGQLRIPLRKFDGPVSRFVLYPDVGDLMRNVIKSRGREELRKVLDKALGRDKEPAEQPQPDGEQPQAPAEPKPKSPEEQVIDQIFDVIFQ